MCDDESQPPVRRRDDVGRRPRRNGDCAAC
jgi:hypothetical protein